MTVTGEKSHCKHPQVVVGLLLTHVPWCEPGSLTDLDARMEKDPFVSLYRLAMTLGIQMASRDLCPGTQPFLGVLLATQRLSSLVCAPLWQLWSNYAWLAVVGSSWGVLAGNIWVP